MAKKKAAPENPVQRWQREIQLAKKHFETWQERGQKVVDRYRDERSEAQAGARRFNILWSNVQTLQPAMYSRPPKVEVSRRYNDADPVGRCASMILERAVDVELERYDIGNVMKPAVEDRLLPGRGTGWVRYEADVSQVQSRVPLTKGEGGLQLSDGTSYEGETEEAEGQTYGYQQTPELQHECTPTDYVYWKDFLCSPARIWTEVRWVARCTYPGRQKLVSRFGDDIGNKVPLDAKPPGMDEDDPAAGVLSCARVWEIWDKTTKKVFWVHESFPQVLDEKPDPLNLECFFPCPKPLSATLTTGSLVPIPDYCQYQDQAKELDDLTERIGVLTKALKVVGVRDASQQGLERMLMEGVDNTLIPVESWAMFAEKGGIKGSVDFLPIEQVIVTVTQLYSNRSQVKNDLYEITGIGDVIRGSSDPNETATAQGIKAKYAGMRLSDKQADVEIFARDLIRLKAEIMAEKYAPETLVTMSGILQTPEGQVPQQPQQPPQPGMPPAPPPPPPDPQNPATWPPVVQQAVQLLKSGLRDFRIDIETRSMAQMDEDADQQARVQFLTSVGGFLQQAATMSEKAPPLMELMGELLRFGVRGFRIGRELESVFDRAMQAMAQQGATDPNAAKEQQQQLEQQQKAVQQGQQQLQADQQAAQEERIRMAEDRIKVDTDKKTLDFLKRIALLEIQNEALKRGVQLQDQEHMLDRQADSIDRAVGDLDHDAEIEGTRRDADSMQMQHAEQLAAAQASAGSAPAGP